MKWTDYREALGIGFSDNDKTPMLKNRLSVLVDEYDNGDYSNETIVRDYFIIVCEKPEHYAWYEVQESIEKESDFPSVLSKGIALVNALKNNQYVRRQVSDSAEAYLEKTLEDINIPFEVIRDEDGVLLSLKEPKNWMRQMFLSPSNG